MLRLFYASIGKKDGEMMKKSSVNLLKYGLAKHLKETAQIDINIDPVFASSKGVFSAVLTDMKKKGFGAVKHKPAICQEDLIKLYDVSGVALNPCTPQGLLNKCWFDVMTFLCRRGRENLRQMTLDTFKINTDGTGRKFVMNYTNHSIRATSITEMDEAGVASRHIMRISGHKSEASIKNYSNRLSDKKRGKYLTVLATL